MKYAGYCLILFIGLLLQTTGFPGLILFGIKPEIMLLLALVLAIINGSFEGAIFGFLSGLMQDLLMGHYIGLYASIIMLVSFGVGYLTKRLYKENFVVRFMAIFAGTAVAKFGLLLGRIIFGAVVFWDGATFITIISCSLLNAFIGLFIFRPLVLLDRRLIYLDELFKRTG